MTLSVQWNMNAIQPNFTLEIPYNNVVQTMELASFNKIWNSIYLSFNQLQLQGMRYEFGSAGEVCCIEVSSVPQNLWVSILLKASKYKGAKGDITSIYKFLPLLHQCLQIPCSKFFIMSMVLSKSIFNIENHLNLSKKKS